MFIATNTQTSSKLRQERHLYSSKRGRRCPVGHRAGYKHAAPDGACFARHDSSYKHGAPTGAFRTPPFSVPIGITISPTMHGCFPLAPREERL